MNVVCSATYMDKNEMMERTSERENERNGMNVSLQPNVERETHTQSRLADWLKNAIVCVCVWFVMA